MMKVEWITVGGREHCLHNTGIITWWWVCSWQFTGRGEVHLRTGHWRPRRGV